MRERIGGVTSTGNGHLGRKPAQPHLIRGVICSIAGGALWGFSGSCIQFLLIRYAIAPLTITCIRMFGSGLIFLVIMLVHDRAGLLEMVRDLKVLGQLAIFGVCGLLFCQTTYAISIGYTNAGTATVLQSTGIVFIMVVTCIIAHRMPHKAEVAGVILACGATWLIATGGDPARLALPLPGLIWGLVNGLTVVIYIMYPRRLLLRFGSLEVTGAGMLIGGIVAACFVVPTSTMPQLDGAGILALAAVVILGTFVSFTLYLQGVKDAGAMRASMLGVSEPVAAMLISWLALGTDFTFADLIGFLMMVVMVLVITRDEAVER